jgi:Ricin-type beta-trefoil lectin domain-like
VAGLLRIRWPGSSGIRSGYYKIEARSSGRVLDVESASTVDWAHIHQWGYEGLANQQWIISPITQSIVYLVNRHSGKAAVVTGSVNSNGTLVRQFGSGWPAANYQWRLEKVP